MNVRVFRNGNIKVENGTRLAIVTTRGKVIFNIGIPLKEIERAVRDYLLPGCRVS